ncbi:RsbT co-antagonist protein RsbRD [Neobacillus piezotolerans]|uniref:RsbT co-antagonist protein RsbRD n=1 Tax=Neobacillus piezotolerans TaxID=2259171 RepID=A0A3D8GTJ7_9BACI|nr:STAS domain-containing protein [Neobacillus piezotolerans]RDU37662.1 RsbT co-antagonist protein RsbRD [Neobacillus piezotolerans]
MKDLDRALYTYLLSHSSEMTEEWLSRRNEKTGSPYSVDASPELINKLRERNRLFIEGITKVFIEEEEEFKRGIIPWTRMVSEDRVNTGVPLHMVIEQFGIFRSVILLFIENFAHESEEELAFEDIFRWSRQINFAFDKVIDLFTKHYYEVYNKQISEKEKIIYELSSPVIPVAKGTGVLPLIGEIDLDRASDILESVLNQSAAMRINKLVIDMSGVPEMDTAVACELSKLFKGLNMIGIRAILSGIRPEVAQAAVTLGINFNNTEFEPDLAAALTKLNWLN